MKLEVDVELDGDKATIRWPQQPVTLDDAGLVALMLDIALVRARLGFGNEPVVFRDGDEV